jgi:hypothetical protein
MNGWMGEVGDIGAQSFSGPAKRPNSAEHQNRPNIVSCTSALEIDSAAAPLRTFVRRNLSPHEFEAAHRVANLGLFGTQTH